MRKQKWSRRAKYISLALIYFLLFIHNHAFAAPNTFLTISDIHFNPFNNCTSSPCPLIDRLNKAKVEDWESIFSRFAFSPIQYHYDTNYALLTISLNAIKQAAQKYNPQFVFVLGDQLSHHYRTLYKQYASDKSVATYRSFVHKTFEFLAKELSEAVPNKNIYIVVGNNDAYLGNYRFKPGHTFFLDMATTWGRLINNPDQPLAKKEFKQAGYYAFNLPENPQLRLIGLNTTLFSKQTLGSQVDLFANQQLDWLDKELDLVKSNHQTAFILMHIPEGVDFYLTLRFRVMRVIALWKPDLATRFDAIIAKHADEIAGIFAGHLHTNWFQLAKFGNKGIPMMGTPSISPIFGNDPAFKLYVYGDDFKILEAITYNYPIHQSHLWGLEYNVKRMYDPDCGECFALQGFNIIKAVRDLTSYYQRYNFTPFKSIGLNYWENSVCKMYSRGYQACP